MHSSKFFLVQIQVNVKAVLETFKENAHKAHDLLIDVIPRIAAEDWSEIIQKKEVSDHTFSCSCYLLLIIIPIFLFQAEVEASRQG